MDDLVVNEKGNRWVFSHLGQGREPRCLVINYYVGPRPGPTRCDSGHTVYPHSQVFLCTWHVLCAMRCHFVMSTFKLLWEKIQIWVKTSDPAEFSKIWEEISTNPQVPSSLIQYLKTEWLNVSEMWSNVSRKNRHIFEEGDTNMLIEAYVILSFDLKFN